MCAKVCESDVTLITTDSVVYLCINETVHCLSGIGKNATNIVNILKTRK